VVIYWKGKKIKTAGDVMYAVKNLQDKQEAQTFLIAYAYERSGDMDGIRSDIRYMAGYYGEEMEKKVKELFDVDHPFLGDTKLDPKDIMKVGAFYQKELRNSTSYEAGKRAGEKALEYANNMQSTKDVVDS
jgi:hypothetical protein